MEGMIGGRPVSEVFAALQRDIPGVVCFQKDTGYPYLDIFKLRAYFEKYVPPENYDFLCGEVRLQQTKDAGFLSCKGTIIIYDDSGRQIRRRSSIGAANINVSSTSGRTVDPSVTARSAYTNTLKACMMAFGCGQRQLDLEKEKRRKSGKGNQRTGSVKELQSSGTENPYGEGTYRVRFQQNGKIRNATSYLLVPVEFLNGRKTQVLIWKNKYASPGKLADFIAAGNEVMVQGIFEAYGNSDRIVYTGKEELTA